MANEIQVSVPDIGDFKNIPVIEVFVKPGDTVKAEDALMTLESDKATMDVPSPVAGVVKEVLVQVSYAIGVAKPTSINVNTYGTAKVKLTDGQIGKIVESVFDMRPYFIEQRLKLRTPMYSETAAYGHMGRKNQTVTKTFTSPDGKSKTMKVELFTWEKLDYVAKVKKAFGLK